MAEEIAPGSILLRMYFKRRIRNLESKKFCEIGAGNGQLCKIMLQAGLTGIAYDLNTGACENNKRLNQRFIDSGSYQVLNSNALIDGTEQKFDVILSCMVIEHLSNDDLNEYFIFCKQHLLPGGKMIVVVPANMKFWGIEDEIVGHFKRYSFQDFGQLAQKYNLKIIDMSGLTYPLSNWLLGLSNFIVRRNESHKKNLNPQEQTVLSGNRNIKFKTSFPAAFKLILNEYVLYPFYLLQLMNGRNDNSSVIYCEMQNKS